MDYRYNRADRLIGMTYPSGALIAYARSGTTGRVSSVSFQPHAGGPVTAIASGFTWQPFGAPTGYFAGNGTFQSRTYTLNGAPETVNGPGLASTYGVDVLGNITTLTGGATQQYQYDALNRLRRVDNASLQRIDAWTYDGTGNRLSQQAGQGPVVTLSYPPTSHRVSVAGVARSYDANGNTTARGSESLFYGDHNRLVTWSSAFGMSNASYQHNPRGERVMKTSIIPDGVNKIGGETPPICLPVQGQSVQTFLYDESGRLIRDTSDPCAARPTNYEFVWLDDQPLAVIDAAPALPSPQLVGHITSDHLHTPRAISNAVGTVTWTWAPVSGNSTSGGSNVFGDRPAQATGAPFNTRAFNLRLPGQYLDAESGLHYNYFRDYEPGTGRYFQSDPIGLQGGIATYTYAANAPTAVTDPFGLFGYHFMSSQHRCGAYPGGYGCTYPQPFVPPFSRTGCSTKCNVVCGLAVAPVCIVIGYYSGGVASGACLASRTIHCAVLCSLYCEVATCED